LDLDNLRNIFYLDFYNISFLRTSIDIFIVSIIFYFLFITLRKTRALQLFIGLGVILLLGAISSYYELELLDWLIDSFRPALLFLVIVLLQPELRRVFSDLTKSRLIKIFLMKPSFELDEIVDAVKTMANSKTGAIIAITRDISLRDIVERSVQVDAIISSSLLLTIFKKNSPLHDGAVIIEQNRIASASSYLPLSDNLERAATMGARHRSALGLSEETDAVIIVTSEERGEISICFNGEMIHPIKPFELKTLLLTYLQARVKSSQNNSNDESKNQSSKKVEEMV
jgi:diadenylate cyclase